MKKSRLLGLLCVCAFTVVSTISCNHDDDDDNTNPVNDDGDNTNPVECVNDENRINWEAFPNGVAAGDVDQSSVWLWARVADADTMVWFEYGRDPTFAVTDGAIDKSVVDPDEPAKVKVDGLLDGTQYYYRACLDECPPGPCTDPLGSEARGKFRTSSLSGLQGLRFGVSSCFRGDMKPFASIKNVPDRDLDFFVNLGDTAYADGDGDAPRGKNLKSFRKKHRLVLSELHSPEAYADEARLRGEPEEEINDNILARVRASTAFYASIDDHEVENDFAGGACSIEASLPTSIWNRLKESPGPHVRAPFVNETSLFNDALQAFIDYNPIGDETYLKSASPRSAGKRKLYRYRTFGEDAALFILDTRSFRDEPLGRLSEIVSLEEATYRANRTMLGCAQLNDLLHDLRRAQDAGIVWKFVLVPEPIQNIGLVGVPDRYEGYARERSLILDYITSACIDNVVFISGDIHGTFVNDLAYRRTALGPRIPTSIWDISTGAVAYDTPAFAAIIEGLELAGTMVDPSFDSLDREAQNSAIEEGLNTQLYLDAPIEDRRYPLIGLDGNYYSLVHSELSDGQYLSINTFGWTEFEIDTERNLTTTTFGIDWYKAPVNESATVTVKGPEDELIYTVGRAEELLASSPFVVSEFRVKPKKSTCPGGPRLIDVPCDPTHAGDQCPIASVAGQEDCCDGFYCSLGTCEACIKDGQTCALDGRCCSGNCSLFHLTCGCRPPGDFCAEDADCCGSGRCPFGICRTCRPIGERCQIDGQCCNDNCTRANPFSLLRCSTRRGEE